jgi:adenosine kinase
MRHSYLNRVADTEGVRIGIVAPDSKQAMIQHSRDFAEAGIPHIFDPGQGMTLFNGEELQQFIEQARFIAVNDYEFQLLKERTGMGGEEIARKVEALIVTRGQKGSVLRTRDGEKAIDPVKAEDVQDPTGCGDAFRAGLIYGLLNDLDLITCCRIGSVMGAIKVAQQGPQNHNPSFEEIEQRFFGAYGYRF